jgi:hypothetical protein
MSERRFRKPNALKHGGFSRIELMPWEDRQEFEELHRGLKEEFEPKGPLQEDCIYIIMHVAKTPGSAFLTGDRVLEDLSTEERLDAAIDRAMKRLYQLKLARQLDRPHQPELIGRKAPMQLEAPDTVANRVKE